MTKQNPLLDASIMDTPSETLSTGEPEVLLDFGDFFRRRDKRQEQEQQEQGSHAEMIVDPLAADAI